MESAEGKPEEDQIQEELGPQDLRQNCEKNLS